MATIRSFRAYRPRPDVAGRVAALPYDVYNRQEAEIEVKREPLSLEDKIRCATDGENGLWLCENHHKLFDANIIRIDDRSGKVSYKKDLTACNYNFLNRITPYDSLPREIMTECFCKYLQKRNRAV